MYIKQSELFTGTSMDFVKKFAENGIVFYKHLAATLGKRLLETYKMLKPKDGNFK